MFSFLNLYKLSELFFSNSVNSKFLGGPNTNFVKFTVHTRGTNYSYTCENFVELKVSVFVKASWLRHVRCTGRCC